MHSLIVLLLVSGLTYSQAVPQHKHSLRGTADRGEISCLTSPFYYEYGRTVEHAQNRTTTCTGPEVAANLTDFNVTVAFTSDLHGHVDTLPRIATLVHKLRQSGRTVLVDSGDISIGTIFAKHHGNGAMSQVMELMGYQAMGVGNHDLEYISELSISIPILSVNVPGFLPSVTLSIGEIKVGFLAYTAVDDGRTPAELLQIIKNEATCMRRTGVNLVLLLGHGQTSFNRYIAENSVGLIDGVLGGHTHQLLGCVRAYCRGPIVLSPGTAGESLGVLRVSRRAGKTSFYSDLVPITDDIPEDPTIKHWLEPKLAALPRNNKVLAEIVGDGLDEAGTCRVGPCLTGAIVTEAIYHHLNCTAIVLFEAGSIRDVFRTNITEFDLVHTLPWDNVMVQYDMPGGVLSSMLQFGLLSVGDNQGKAFLHAAGLVYQNHTVLIDESISDSGGAAPQCPWPPRRLNEAHDRDIHKMQDIDPHHVYRVAVTDWLASGGDSFGPFLAKASKITPSDTNVSHVMVRDMVEKYLRATPIIHTLAGGRKVTDKATPSVDLSLPAIVKALPLSSSMHSAIAIAAEIPSMILSHPLRTISARQQTPTNNNEQTAGGVWNGVTLTLVAMFLSKIVFWGVYYYVFDFLASWGGQVSALQRGLLGFGSSMAAGVGETLATHPFWVIVTRVQVFGHSKNDVLYENLCDGVVISLILVFFPCVRQFIFEYFVFVTEILIDGESSPVMQGALGTAATIVATVLTYPLQTVRTRMQTNTFESGEVRLGSLFAGLGSKLLAATVHAFIFFFCVKLFEMFVLSR